MATRATARASNSKRGRGLLSNQLLAILMAPPRRSGRHAITELLAKETSTPAFLFCLFSLLDLCEFVDFAHVNKEVEATDALIYL